MNFGLLIVAGALFVCLVAIYWLWLRTEQLQKEIQQQKLRRLKQR